jgi:Icc-related predicted phosphoesterase
MTSAGSSACRSAVEKHQPMLGIHGHIHESHGFVMIGRTLCANPGSDYGEGVLRGFLTEIEGDRIKSHMLTTG